MLSANPSLKAKLLLLSALGFWLWSSLYHLKFSLWITQPWITPWGSIILKDHASNFFIVFAIISLKVLIWQLKCHPQKNQLIIYWLIWIALVVSNNFYFMATPVENIHLIQYALISYLICASWQLWPNSSAKPSLIIIFSLSLGIIDEVLQYTIITKSYSQYLDFNDFNLNLIAIYGGLLWFYTLHGLSKAQLALSEVCSNRLIGYSLLIAILILGLSASLTGLDIERVPNSYAHWHPDFFQGRFYVLSPIHGILSLLVIFIIFLPLYKKIN